MSGGSHNYIYSRLSSECEGEMHDVEMNDLIKDLCEVLHDLEWWQSGDYSEDQYRETVSEFKKKWFDGENRSMVYNQGNTPGLRDYFMPSVTPQPRKGHWIPVFQGDEIIDYRCSCCEFGNTFGKGTVGMNYCPRCGSRNEVEDGTNEKTSD